MALEKNKIYQNNCVKQLAKLATLDKRLVGLVFADPPFIPSDDQTSHSQPIDSRK